MREYEELRIRIWKTGASRYLVFANGPSTAAAVITLRTSPQEYRARFNELLDEEFRRRPGRSGPVRERLQELGREIFDTFLPNPIYECLKQSADIAERNQRRLRLRFDVAQELADIPFEFLFAPPDEPREFLARRASFSIVRSIVGSANPLRAPAPADKRERLDLLVVVAAQSGGQQTSLNTKSEV